MLKKIAIIGAESTGKTQLCQDLAAHYQVHWCPEFAREYLLMHGREYDYDDLEIIAKGQVALEESYIHRSISENKNFLFIDTDMYIMKVWSEYVYSRCPFYILEQIVLRKYDLYLFTDIDIPWQKDELREYPDLKSRRELHYMYKDCLINQNTPWHLVSGHAAQRTQNAIAMLVRAFSYT